jgi:hypothetical protein
MKAIEIRVRSQGDVEPAFPEFTTKPVVAEVYGAGILDGATEKKKTAVVIVAQLPDGNFVDVFFTEGLWQLVNACFVGAQERFAEEKRLRELAKHGVRNCACPAESAGKGRSFCFTKKNPNTPPTGLHCKCKCHSWLDRPIGGQPQ